MHRKPLVNENLLQKITKAPPFQFHSKRIPLKPSFGFKSLKNIEIFLPINKQLQTCIEIIKQQIQQKVTNNLDFLQQIAKLLLNIKAMWQSAVECKILQTEFEQQEKMLQIMRKSSNNHFNRNKMELSGQPRLIQGYFFTDKYTNGQLKKNVMNKLKTGKENNSSYMFSNKIKIEKIIKQLEQAEKMVDHQKGQIQSMKKQIQNLINVTQQLRNSKISMNQEIVAMRNKMKRFLDEKIRLESDLYEKIRVQKQKTQQSSNECKVLHQRLYERQKQISALWQLQKN